MCLTKFVVRAIIIVILIIRAQLIQCATVDYCRIQSKSCFNRHHVGCSSNTASNSNIPLKAVRFKAIVDIVNGMRRDFSNSSKIGNMNLIGWDDELTYLAEQKIIKAEPDCFATDRHDKVYMFTKEFVGSGFFIFLETRDTRYLHKEDVENSELLFMNPETTDIGCTAYFKDNIYEANFNLTNSPNVVLVCLLNGIQADYNGMYKPGEPCSACENCKTNLCSAATTKPIFYQILLDWTIWILLIIVAYLIVAISAVLYFIYRRGSVVL